MPQVPSCISCIRPFVRSSMSLFSCSSMISSSIVRPSRSIRSMCVKCSRCCVRRSSLYAKEGKCEFFKTEVEFLGHIVGRDGVRMMEDKVQAMKEWPTPTNVRDVRAFLGTTGYYRKFIKDFSSISSPLSELTKSNVRFSWGPEQQTAFTRLA